LRWKYGTSSHWRSIYANRLVDAVPVWAGGAQRCTKAGPQRPGLAVDDQPRLRHRPRSARFACPRAEPASASAPRTPTVSWRRAAPAEPDQRWHIGCATSGAMPRPCPCWKKRTTSFVARRLIARSRSGLEHRLAQAFQQLGQPARSQVLLAGDHDASGDGAGGDAPVAPRRPRPPAGLRCGDTAAGGAGPWCRSQRRLPPPGDLVRQRHRAAQTRAKAWPPAWPPGPAPISCHGMALAGHVRAAGCALAQGACNEPSRMWRPRCAWRRLRARPFLHRRDVADGGARLRRLRQRRRRAGGIARRGGLGHAGPRSTCAERIPRQLSAAQPRQPGRCSRWPNGPPPPRTPRSARRVPGLRGRYSCSTGTNGRQQPRLDAQPGRRVRFLREDELLVAVVAQPLQCRNRSD